MSNQADLEHLVGLVQRLNDLAADVAETYEPAAKRLGCFLAVAHMQSFRRSVDSGPDAMSEPNRILEASARVPERLAVLNDDVLHRLMAATSINAEISRLYHAYKNAGFHAGLITADEALNICNSLNQWGFGRRSTCRCGSLLRRLWRSSDGESGHDQVAHQVAVGHAKAARPGAGVQRSSPARRDLHPLAADRPVCPGLGPRRVGCGPGAHWKEEVVMDFANGLVIGVCLRFLVGVMVAAMFASARRRP